ncbi:MAG: Spx/MgsR family RNA polymerase-binding regulatory protein [Pigmentiphaga sp.]|nr:Spx/MgsR family RNA polymerase-binding regulatory protein [Pigmentiphaga sp.]
MSSTTLQLYGLKRCDTCVKAQRWLAAQDVDFAFTDYREHPIAPERLREWAGQLGGWEKLVNRASTTWRNLPEAAREPANDDAWLALIAEHPALVRRPVLLTPDGTVSVGFKEAVWRERLSLA